MESNKIVNFCRQTLCKINITLFIGLIIILLMTIHLNKAHVNQIMDNQTKFNEYLKVLDLYELITEKEHSNVKRYILSQDEEYLERYQIFINSHNKTDLIEQLYNLGFSHEEQAMMERVIYLSLQISNLQLQAIAEIGNSNNNQTVGLLAIDPYVENEEVSSSQSLLFSETYNEYLRQHRDVLEELKVSINNRMKLEIIHQC